MAEPVFVGRKTEIGELEACLSSAVAKRGKTVFIQGEAGTGKSRLMNEFLKTADQKRIVTMAGWCLSNASMPYFPFAEAFRDLAEKGGLGAKFGLPKKMKHEVLTAAHRLTKFARGLQMDANVSPKVWKDLTFASVADAIQVVSQICPVILFIDDVQWADSASLALLHYLSRGTTNNRILIAATFRSEELQPIQEGKAHPLVETMRLMRREDLLQEIMLPNLSQPEVAKLAEDIAGGALHQEFLTKLMTESQGNPLFVVESMRMLLENNDLVDEGGIFHLATKDLGIPTKVKELILRRMDSLKIEHRKLLDLASVIGEKFDPALIARATSTGSIEILEQLNAISISTHLVYPAGESVYGFDHAKTREVLYGGIPPSLRREYHARIAETLEKTLENSKEGSINDIAYHYAQTANGKKAFQYSVAAGEDALAKYSNEEAYTHFTYALKIASDLEIGPERDRALEGLGDALLAKGTYETAMKTFEKLADNENGILRLRSLRKAATASQWQGDLNHALELVKKAEECITLDRLEKARLLIRKGRIVGFLGDAKSAIRYLEEAVQIAEEEYSLTDAAQALKEVAVYYSTQGQVIKALAAARRALALHQDLQNLEGQMETLSFEGNVLFTYGLLKEALEDYRETTKIAEKLGALNEITMSALYTSALLESTGNLNEALVTSLNNLQYSEKTDSQFLQYNNYLMLTRLYAKLGDTAHAEEFHLKLMNLFDKISQKTTRLAHASGLYSSAVFSDAKKQYEEANTLFEDSLTLLKTAAFSTLFEPLIKADYASCLAKQGRVIEAQKLIEESQKIHENLNSQLDPGEVQAFLITKRKTAVYEVFEARLDIINISKTSIQLLSIESLVPPAFNAKITSSSFTLHDDSVDMAEKELGPLDVETIKLVIQPKRAGIFNVTPSISCRKTGATNDSVYIIEPAKIIVYPKQTLEQPKLTIEGPPTLEFEFKTESSKKAFNYLLSAFIQDYMRRRLPLEWSGWRTLMEIVRHTNLSRHSVYGDETSRGRAILELQNRGLVEARVFPKERGRGGKITKVRIFYEKEIIKRRIDQEISNPNRKNPQDNLLPH